MFSSAVGLGKGIMRGKMEDQVMKEAHELVAACNLKLPLVYRWLQCQQLYTIIPFIPSFRNFHRLGEELSL